MAQYFRIHPETPQQRLLVQSACILRDSGVIVYPTDSSYALGCRMGDKNALERIRQIRQLSDKKPFTVVCRDLSEISSYAQIDNTTFRTMKSLTPGPFTFILKAKRDVPKRLQGAKRQGIGIRVPDHPIAQGLLDILGEPIISISLVLPEQDLPENDPALFAEKLGNRVDLIIDGGVGGLDFTTVIDMTGQDSVVMREGKGFEQLALN